MSKKKEKSGVVEKVKVITVSGVEVSRVRECLKDTTEIVKGLYQFDLTEAMRQFIEVSTLVYINEQQKY